MVYILHGPFDRLRDRMGDALLFDTGPSTGSGTVWKCSGTEYECWLRFSGDDFFDFVEFIECLDGR